MKTLLVLILTALMLSGCSGKPQEEVPQAALEVEETVSIQESVYTDTVVLDIQEPEQEAEIILVPPEPIRPDILQPVASGELTAENGKAIIDYSHAEDGYVMVRYIGDRDCRLKVRVINETTYTYNLTKGEWEVFPFTDGNGTYQIKVYENTSGSSYAIAMATELEVTLEDEFAPFLRPNQYVNFSDATKAVELAWELTKDIDNPLLSKNSAMTTKRRRP